MQEKDAEFFLRKGKETIALPSAGGYKIEWSPGTRLLATEVAPSGHLVIPCDSFAEAVTDPLTATTFATDHTVETRPDTGASLSL